MTVMRMLAFQPRKHAGGRPSDQQPQSARPDSGEGNSSAAPPAAGISGISGASGASGASAAPRVSGTGKPDLQNIGTSQGWQNLIDQSGLNGIKRTLLMNMSPVSVDGHVVTVALESSRRALFTEDRKRQIEQHFRERFSMDMRLKVKLEDLSQATSENNTPAQKIEQQKLQEQEAARQAFINDRNVQKMIEVFDAEVVSDSIRKIKQ